MPVIVVTFVVVVILMVIVILMVVVYMILVVIMVVVIMVMVMIVVVMVVMVVVSVIVMILMTMLVMAVVVVVAMSMDLAVKMLRFTPHQSRADRRLDGQTAAIAEAPLKDAAKQTIEGVMPWAVLKIVVESGMPLNSDDRCEIKLPFLHTVGTTSTVAAVGKSSWCMDQGEQKQSQKQAAGTKHGTKHGTKREKRHEPDQRRFK